MPALVPTVLSTAQTGNGNSAVAVIEDEGSLEHPGAVIITSTVGATPTVTVNIQGSVDGTNFFNIPYALTSSPSSFVTTAITITTATTTTYLLQGVQPWVFLRLAYSANTNVTLTATAYL